MRNILLKATLFCSSFIALHGQNTVSNSELEKMKLQALIVGSHVRTYSVDSFFDEPLQFKFWQEAMDELNNYVINKSKNIFDMKDSDLINNLFLLNGYNRTLQTLISSAYVLKDEKEKLKKLIPVAMKLLHNMVILVKKIEQLNFFVNNKKRAKAILLITAQITKSTALKAAREINEHI